TAYPAAARSRTDPPPLRNPPTQRIALKPADRSSTLFYSWAFTFQLSWWANECGSAGTARPRRNARWWKNQCALSRMRTRNGRERADRAKSRILKFETVIMRQEPLQPRAER